VRWATPVIHFRRTATEDTMIGNTKVQAGQKVVMFYNSANRDERVFTDPYSFDVRRPLQPQQAGFGAGGPHFCLGANLARLEAEVAVGSLVARFPSMKATGAITWRDRLTIRGVDHLELSF